MTTEAEIRHGLYIEHRTALIDYAARILGSREAAEDIVQDAYLRFTPGQSPIGSPRQTVAYLYRVVRNLSFDVLKRRKVEARQQEGEPLHWTIPVETENPEQALMFCDQVRVASEALASLPDDARTAVEMYRFGGHTLEVVARHLDVSVATVHRHVKSAMMKIALALDAPVS